MDGRQLATGNWTPGPLPTGSRDLQLGFACFKVDADINYGKYHLRHCLYTLTKGDINQCEKLENEYEIVEGVVLKNAEICFCNQDGCNEAGLIRGTNSRLLLFLLVMTLIMQNAPIL